MIEKLQGSSGKIGKHRYMIYGGWKKSLRDRKKIMRNTVRVLLQYYGGGQLNLQDQARNNPHILGDQSFSLRGFLSILPVLVFANSFTTM